MAFLRNSVLIREWMGQRKPVFWYIYAVPYIFSTLLFTVANVMLYILVNRKLIISYANIL